MTKRVLAGVLCGGVVAISVGGWTPDAHGQCPGGGVWGAASGQFPNGPVLSITRASTGEVIVAGAFSTPGRRIARFNPTTGAWTGFGSSLLGTALYAAVELPNRDVVAGGDQGLWRWKASNNTWSRVDGVSSAQVNALVRLPDGRVVAGGSFNSGARLAVVDPATGTGTEVAGGPNGEVAALAVAGDGSVYVGGYFTSVGGQAASRVARWSPTSGTWTALGAGVNSVAMSLLVLPGGDVLVGGDFTTAGDGTASRLARWSPTSGTWSEVGGGVNDRVTALTATSQGEVIVGGLFIQTGRLGGSGGAGGVQSHPGIARLDPVTERWSPVGGGVSSTVYAVHEVGNGRLIVGGAFLTAGSVNAPRIAQVWTRRVCAGDFNCSQTRSVDDVFAYVRAYLEGDALADVDGDGAVAIADLYRFLSDWLAC